LIGSLNSTAFAAHSAKFERQWCTPDIVGEVPWICTYKCALRAWPEAPGHSNQTLRYWLNPVGLNRASATPAHRAGPDAYVTAFLLRELLRLHPLEDLLKWSSEPAVLIRVPFGKRSDEGGWRGTRWADVEEGFLYWVERRDFSEDILHTVRLEIARREQAHKGADSPA
jgi:exodeoxyribonuclease X